MARRIDPRKLAWMAGVVETRGKIRRVDNPMRRSPQVILQVRSRHLNLIRRLGGLTGTEVRISDSRTILDGARRGCIDHCPEAHVHLGTEIPKMGLWSVTGTAAAIVLHNLAEDLDSAFDLSVVDDYLSGIKLPEDWRRPGPGMRAVWESVNRLRVIGWEIPEPLTVIPRTWPAAGT